MTSKIQALGSNAAVVLKEEVYIFYYDAQTSDLFCLISPLAKGPTPGNNRATITITKGSDRTQIQSAPNYTSWPLAAAADPATNTVWVYFTDAHGIVNDAYTNDGGRTWARGDSKTAGIQVIGNHTMSAWFDHNLKQPRLVFAEVDNYNWTELCEAYDSDDFGSWKTVSIEP